MKRTALALTVNDILGSESNDLLTEEEKGFNRKHVQMLRDYADGKVEGIQLKNMTAGASTVAKRQQSRRALAVLKWSMVHSGTDIVKQVEGPA